MERGRVRGGKGEGKGEGKGWEGKSWTQIPLIPTDGEAQTDTQTDTYRQPNIHTNSHIHSNLGDGETFGVGQQELVKSH